MSVVNLIEAEKAISGGADIVDVKNPSEGALGANFPWVLNSIRHTFPDIELSATLGDLPDLPGTAALAAQGAASCGVQYVKVGLFGARSELEAAAMTRAVVKAVSGRGVITVAVGYADYFLHGSIDPLLLPRVASQTGVSVLMIDVKTKDEKSLLDHMSLDVLKHFVGEAHSLGLRVGLAGSLKANDLTLLLDTGADVLGVRRSACRSGESGTLNIAPDLVRSLSEKVRAV